MHRLLPLLLLAACAAPREYHQGAARPPRPPAFNPAWDAPHTTGQPGAKREPVPRSPHARLLQPTREPGLWSGDRPRASDADASPTISGVPVPFPEDASTLFDKFPTLLCAEQMQAAVNKTDADGAIRALSERARRCFVAQLHNFCSQRIASDYERDRREALDYNEPHYKAVQGMKKSAAAFAQRECGGMRLAPDEFDLFQKVTKQWATDVYQ